jgi:hypothetical protein
MQQESSPICRYVPCTDAKADAQANASTPNGTAQFLIVLDGAVCSALAERTKETTTQGKMFCYEQNILEIGYMSSKQ